jgi:hypothetical protein
LNRGLIAAGVLGVIAAGGLVAIVAKKWLELSETAVETAF